MTDKRNADHDYIEARQQRFSEAWMSGSVESLLGFFDKEDFVYSHHGQSSSSPEYALNTDLLWTISNQHTAGRQTTTKKHSDVRDLLHLTFTNYEYIKVKTRSLHGHKRFTAWEWTILCKRANNTDEQRPNLDEIAPQRLTVCSLMWWNENDKIVRYHEYAQMRDCDHRDDGEGFEKVKTHAGSLEKKDLKIGTQALAALFNIFGFLKVGPLLCYLYRNVFDKWSTYWSERGR